MTNSVTLPLKRAKAHNQTKLVVRLGKDTVIGFGEDYPTALHDGLLTLIQTTRYQFTAGLPNDVFLGNCESFVSSPTSKELKV